jgi:hypothetical protein
MNLDFNLFIQNPVGFFWAELYPALMNLEPAAIAILGILLILLLVWVVLLVQFFAWLLSLMKRFILFLVVIASLIVFFLRFQDELLMQPPNYALIAAGAIGVVFAFIALLISLLSIRREWATAKAMEVGKIKERMREAVEEELAEELEKKAKLQARPEITPTQAQQPQLFSKQALRPKNILGSFHDRSLLAVLSYIVVAEFGVFSSVTVAAPSATAGLGLFVAFMVAAFIFIRTSYYSYVVGIRHLAIGAAFGIALSIVLGNIWVGTALETLLSLEYFATNSLVAFITGLAVSLFMGSKG